MNHEGCTKQNTGFVWPNFLFGKSKDLGWFGFSVPVSNDDEDVELFPVAMIDDRDYTLQRKILSVATSQLESHQPRLFTERRGSVNCIHNYYGACAPDPTHAQKRVLSIRVERPGSTRVYSTLHMCGIPGRVWGRDYNGEP